MDPPAKGLSGGVAMRKFGAISLLNCTVTAGAYRIQPITELLPSSVKWMQ
jgi:hypothetical protein